MVTHTPYDTYRLNGWKFENSFFDTLGDYEKSFIDLELGTYKSLDFYKRRLEVIGFQQKQHVLDAGCGIGQWSSALAALNHQVSAIDISADRIKTAKHLNEAMNTTNVSFNVGGLEKLPYPCAGFEDYGFEDGKNCFVTAPEDAGKNAKKIISKPNLLAEVTLNGWNHVRREHSLDNRINQIFCCIEKIYKGKAINAQYNRGNFEIQEF